MGDDHKTPVPGHAHPTRFRVLNPDASLDQILFSHNEMARAYAEISFGYNQRLPQLEADSRLRDSELVVVGAIARRAEAATAVHARRLEAIESSRPPPSRPESKSSSDLARHLGKDVAAKFDAEQRNTSTPPPGPDAVERMVEERAKRMILEIRSADMQARLSAIARAEELAAEAQRERERGRRRLIVAAGMATITSVAYLLEHFFRG